jgi:Tfp pilus assembly protein PilE
MADTVQRVGSVPLWVMAITAVIAVAQYVQSVQQSKTTASIAFISIHNNERFYDARQEFLNAQKELLKSIEDPKFANIPIEQRRDIVRDWVIAKEISNNPAKSEESITDKQDNLGLALIQLYDSVAKCMDESICRADIADHHFRGFAQLILNSYKGKLPQWEKQFQGIGHDTERLAKGEISDKNFAQGMCAMVGLDKYCP